MPGLASYICIALYPSEKYEQSNVVYVGIMSLPADPKDTVLLALKRLHKKLIIELGFKWLVVVALGMPKHKKYFRPSDGSMVVTCSG